jgi:hypothetical protein
MTEVITATKKYLKHDHYSIEDSDDEDNISANNNPKDNDSDDLSLDEDGAHNSHTHYVKKDA